MRANVMLTVKGGRFDGQEYVFQRPTRCLVGRGLDCDLRLPSGKDLMVISRHHCVLDVAPPSIRVWDCGSRNGTWVNGMQIGRPFTWFFPQEVVRRPCVSYELHEGDELKIGNLVFQVHVPRPQESCTQKLVDVPETERLFACY
jgi:pSer/pThr/pTyr-binding forkhead associated (FHA) protein